MWAVNQTKGSTVHDLIIFLLGAKSTSLINLLAMGKLPKGMCNKDVTKAIRILDDSISSAPKDASMGLDGQNCAKCACNCQHI
jgi:hypothetical protein